MTRKEAEALVLFVKDHDTRYLPTVVGDEPACRLQLTAKDGAVLEPLGSAEEYHAQYIDVAAAGPTMRAAWEKWRP